MPLNIDRRVTAVLALLVTLLASPRAMAQDDAAAKLSALMQGHVYPGLLMFGKEKVRRVEFATSHHLLGIEVDDAEETAPVSVIVALQDVGNVNLSKGIAGLICKKPGCVAITSETLAPALSKVVRGTGADLPHLKRKDRFEFGYRPAHGRDLYQTLVALVKAAGSK